MYKVTITNDGVSTTIHSPYINNLKLASGTVKKAVNSVDSFTMSFYINNPANSKIKPLKTLVSVYNTKTNKYEFKGRVLSPSEQMDSSGIITNSFECEGELGFLHDSIQRHLSFTGTPRELLENVLTYHNNQVEEYKQFQVGNVTIPNSNTDISVSLSAEKDTFNTIKEKLLDSLGGELQVREENDIRYLDYVEKIGKDSNTVIKLAKNLISITKDVDPTSIITRLTPLGANIQTGTTAIGVSQPRLTIESVNNNLPYIDHPDLIAEFGIQGGTQIWNDVTVPNNLLTKAREWLNNQKTSINQYQLNATDLFLIGLDIDKFEVGNTHHVINVLMGINERLRIIGTSIDITSPEKSTLTIGDKIKTLQEYQNESNQSAQRVVELESTIVYQTQTLGNLQNEINVVDAHVQSVETTINDADLPGLQQSMGNLQIVINDLEQSVQNMTTYSLATQTSDGLMSAEDKIKLDNLTATNPINLDETTTKITAIETSVNELNERVAAGGTSGTGGSNAEVVAARGQDTDLKARLDRMEQEAGETKTEVTNARGGTTNLNTRLTQINTAATNNTNEITAARGGAANLNTRLTNMTTATTNNTNEITAARGTDTNLNARLDKMTTATTTNTSGITAIRDEVTTARGGKVDLNARLTEIETDIDGLNQRVATGGGSGTGGTVVSNAEVEAARGGKANLNERLDEMTANITNNTNGINTVRNNITTAQNEINGLDTRLTEVSAATNTNTTDITAIENNITTIQGDITAIEGNITTIQGDNTNIKAQLTQINQATTTNTQEIATIKGDNTNINTRLDEINAANTTITGEMAEIRTENAGINAQLTQINQTTANNTNDITAIENEVTTARGGAANLNERLTDIETTTNANASGITAMQGEVTTIKNDNANINTRLTQINQANTNITNEFATIKNDITTIQSDNTNINARLTDIDTATTTNTNDITALRNEITTARGGAANLNTRLTGINTATTTNTNEITAARGGRANLNTRLNEMTTATTTNTNDITAIENNITTIQGNITTIQGNITTIQGDNTNIKTRLTSVENATIREQNILWQGSNYMQGSQTITPDKPLDQCRNGWLLVWSDYNPRTTTTEQMGVNDVDWVYSYIPKTVTKGKNVLFGIPSFLGTGSSRSTIKSLTFTNANITGHNANNQDVPIQNNDVVLREVREW